MTTPFRTLSIASLAAWIVCNALPVHACLITEPPTSDAPTTQPTEEQERIARRLLRQDSKASDPVRDAINLMNEAADRMLDKQDTGLVTQDIHGEVLQALDDAIAKAREDARQSAGKSGKGESRSAGRRSGTPQRREGTKPGQRRPDGRNPGGAPADGASESGDPLPDRDELQRGWGYLPDRDREAIIQGARDEFIERYRSQIEAYYRAIAAAAEESR